MSEVKSITLANGQTIYVEMESADIPTPPSSQPSDLPEGAKAINFADDAIDAIQALKDNIKVMAETTYESLQTYQPDEWSLEINIGFKGKTSPIPVILTSEASGSIKVTAKWKKPENKN